MDEPIGGVIGSLVAIFGVVMTALGFKSRFDSLEKVVVYKDTCEKCAGGYGGRLDRLEQMVARNHTEQMELIKTVYKSIPKREGDC